MSSISLPYELTKWKNALYISMGLWLFTTFITMIKSFSVSNELDKPGGLRSADQMMTEIVSWEEWGRNLWIISGLLFLCFLWRGTSNLIAAGIATKRGAGWSVGGWFIPIGFLWIPYQTVRELIETRPDASDPYGSNYETDMIERNANYWLGIWIVSILAFFVLDRFVFDNMLENAETLKDWTGIWNYIGFMYLVQTVLIISYFFVVNTISKRQED